MKLRLPRKWRRQTPIFLIGLGLFAVGVAGFAYEAWQVRNNQLARLVSDQVVFMAEVPTEHLENLAEGTIDNWLPSWLSDESMTSEDLAKWIGKNVGLIAVDDKHFVLGARYRSKTSLKQWVESRLLPAEKLTTTKTDQGEVWTPGFSSQQAFLVTDKWMFVGDSLETLQTALNPLQPLAESETYKKAFADLPRAKDGRLYVNWENFFTNWDPTENLAVYQPLTAALGQTMPALGLTLNQKNEAEWRINSQFLLSEIAADDGVETIKIKNTTIPDLARYAPNDAMFFLNGQELYARYLHTKNFLGELNPQFELIFDGLLRAQIAQWFGDMDDLEGDFLAKIKGPYAIMLDYSDGVDWLFVTKTEVGSTFEELIKAAQGQFSPRVETVELPDGTTREELVAAAPGEVNIQSVDSNGWTYSVTQSASLNKGQLAFVQAGDYFLITSNKDLLESALEAEKSNTASLANNGDFRQAVLFNLGQAESFGFMNMAKIRKMTEPLISVPNAEDEVAVSTPWWQDLVALPIRNIILSRRVEDDRVQMNWLLFGN